MNQSVFIQTLAVLVLSSLQLGCMAPGGRRSPGSSPGTSSPGQACTTNTECPTGQTCQLPAQKPGDGACNEDNGTPGCDDACIEACVCKADGFCCGQLDGGYWDLTCVQIAADTCAANCGAADEAPNDANPAPSGANPAPSGASPAPTPAPSGTCIAASNPGTTTPPLSGSTCLDRCYQATGQCDIHTVDAEYTCGQVCSLNPSQAKLSCLEMSSCKDLEHMAYSTDTLCGLDGSPLEGDVNEPAPRTEPETEPETPAQPDTEPVQCAKLRSKGVCGGTGPTCCEPDGMEVMCNGGEGNLCCIPMGGWGCLQDKDCCSAGNGWACLGGKCQVSLP